MARVPQRGHRYVPQYLPNGTLISRNWDEEWIDKVIEVEGEIGYAICGAKKRNWDEDKPLSRVCRKQAGYGTDHSGEGRCKFHDSKSTLKHGQNSMLRHRNIALRVEEYLESQDVMDIRNAVAAAWASLDEALGEDAEIDVERATQIASTMSRIGTLVKQHHDITEGQRLVIDVPQFMEWAEFLYTLAVRHIQLAGGDVGGFLSEAQSYYTSAIGTVIGNSTPALGTGDPDEAQDLL